MKISIPTKINLKDHSDAHIDMKNIEFFAIYDILNIKQLIRSKKLSFEDVAKMHNTSVENIKHIVD